MTENVNLNPAPCGDAISGGTHCEFLTQCGLFAHLCQSRDKVYRKAFCEGDFMACERRRLRLQGIDMPDDLLPHGYRMQPDGSAYPSIDPTLPCNTRPVEIGLAFYWFVVLALVVISSQLV